MVLPTKLTVHNVAYAPDGGTTVLQAIDETGRECAVMLVQHAFPQPSPSLGLLPGRLYFDGGLIPMRSDLEAGVLSLLRDSEVRYSEQRRTLRGTRYGSHGIPELGIRSSSDLGGCLGPDWRPRGSYWTVGHRSRTACRLWKYRNWPGDILPRGWPFV